MDVSYLVRHEQVSNLLFPCIVFNDVSQQDSQNEKNCEGKKVKLSLSLIK
jgi:hypothetical protein